MHEWVGSRGMIALVAALSLSVGAACTSDEELESASDGGDAVELDAPFDVELDVSVSDGDADACEPPNAWLYDKPGCGDDAAPRCGSPIQDACAITLCSCDGRTIVGCQWAYEPWQSYGACDAGTD